MNEKVAALNATAEASVSVDQPRRWPQAVVWAGVAITGTGAISYFLYFAQFPTLRDSPWLNLPIVLVGLALTMVGTFKVYAQGGGVVSKGLASFGVLLAAAITGLFNFYIFSLSYQLPTATGAPAVQEAAPEFTLLDQTGQAVSLSDYRGRKVALVFYRGYW